MDNLLWLVPLLPLAGFVLLAFLGPRLGRAFTSVVAVGTVAAAFAISLTLFFNHHHGMEPARASLGQWFAVGTLRVNFGMVADELALLWLLVITGVGSLIHLYSVGYMGKDERYSRYMSYLNLFVFFMLTLVVADSFLLMFVGWEGVGLCSYLLIGFWFKNIEYSKAARKAFVMNRIGDFGLLLALFLITIQFGSMDFADVLPAAGEQLAKGSPMAVAIAMLLFVGAMGKSAQLPLYTWLPDAMAGPTPVSALIHAATMVTAGIYLLARCSTLFALAPQVMTVIAIIGAATALFAATIAIYQSDIKKVLAYSTVSQLGFMFMALGVGAFTSGVFHVITHAFFKALLFLCAGSVIHAMSGAQDMRGMGGLRKALPITFVTMLIGTLAISGIPPFSGFFSKDEILAHVYEASPILWGVGFAASLCTAFYMFRMLYLTFWGTFRGTADEQAHLHESPASMTFPLIALAGLAAVGGFIGLPWFIGKHRLENYLHGYFEPAHEIMGEHAAPLLSTELALMAVSTLGALVMWFLARRSFAKPNEKALQIPETGFGGLLANKYYVDELYDGAFVNPTLAASKIYSQVDKTLIDGAVNGSGTLVQRASGWFTGLQTGNIAFYVMAMVVAVVAVMALGIFQQY